MQNAVFFFIGVSFRFRIQKREAAWSRWETEFNWAAVQALVGQFLLFFFFQLKTIGPQLFFFSYALNTTRYVAANAPHDVLPALSVTYHPYRSADGETKKRERNKEKKEKNEKNKESCIFCEKWGTSKCIFSTF